MNPPSLKFKNCGHTGVFKVYESPTVQQSLTSRSLPEDQIKQESRTKQDSLVETSTKIETEFLTNDARSKYLLDSGHMSDIAFRVYNDETKRDEIVNCHKLILASRSRVFNKLFNGQNAEKSNEIKINDVEAKSFKNLLR